MNGLDWNYPPFVETTVSRLVFRILDRARSENQCAAIIGYPGVGKTLAVQEWMARHRIRSYVTCTGTIAGSMRSLLSEIADVFSIYRERGIAATHSALMRARYTPGDILILDEAQNLPHKHFRELLYLWDETRLPIVFCGNHDVLKQVNVDKSFQLVQDALDAKIPRELMQDASKVPGVDLGQRAVQVCMSSLTLTLEHEQAALATAPENYAAGQKVTLAGNDKWSSPESDPLGDVEEAKEAVRTSCGVDPNRMVLSKPGFKALRNHPKIVERFKYTSADSITAAMLANLLDLDVIAVGKAMRLDGDAKDAPLVDVWNNSAVLAYVPAAPIGPEEPSFGYTYTLKGHPFVEQAAWDNNVKSWVHGVTYERSAVLTGIASGFLFQNVN